MNMFIQEKWIKVMKKLNSLVKNAIGEAVIDEILLVKEGINGELKLFELLEFFAKFENLCSNITELKKGCEWFLVKPVHKSTCQIPADLCAG